MNQSVFRLTLPILFGYLPLGMAFGVLFTTQRPTTPPFLTPPPDVRPAAQSCPTLF